jgi:GxxExxY protein
VKSVAKCFSFWVFIMGSDINAITEKIIGCAYTVHNELGCGFLEKVYENALAVEMREQGLAIQQQQSITVKYKGQIVGDYMADMVIDNSVLVELKAAKEIAPVHVSQCLHYLKATGLKVCLLLNFGTESLGIKRLVI